MRVFLSHASEQERIADSIALGLRQEGHDVFFDKDELAPGQSFDDKIRTHLKSSDALVFLVSPESIAPGSYTLTELKFARERWPSPSGRVLPVMVVPTPYPEIPEYLKAGTILEPKGNAVAEAVAAFEELAHDIRKKRSRIAWAAIALSLVILGGVVLLLKHSEKAPGAKRVRFVTSAGDCPAGLTGKRATVVIAGRSVDKTLGADCTIQLDSAGAESATILLDVTADYAVAAESASVSLADEPAQVVVEPNTTTPRVRIAVLSFDGVTPSDPSRLAAQSSFRGMLASRLENLAQELLDRTELRSNELARRQLTKLKLTPLDEPQQAFLDLEQKLDLWRQRHCLGLLTGTLTAVEAPGPGFEVRTQVFIGDLDGFAQGRSFSLVARVSPEAFGETGDVHVLALLYALAMDARRLGEPPEVQTAYLGRAFSMRQSLAGTGAGASTGAAEIARRLDEAMSRLNPGAER